jgi:hypothetical protein
MIPTGRPGCEYGTAVYQTFGRHTPIQRCRVHKARNILERLPKPLHAAVRAVLRQAWGLDDADKAERLIRNLARRLEQQAPGVAASLLEGLDRDPHRHPPSAFLPSCAARWHAPTSSRR